MDSLKPIQIQAIKLMVTTTMTNKEISENLEVSEQTIYNWLKDDGFKNELELEKRLFLSEIENECSKRYTTMVKKAWSVIDDLIENGNDKLRYQIAKDILDRYQELKPNYNFIDIEDIKSALKCENLIMDKNSDRKNIFTEAIKLNVPYESALQLLKFNMENSKS